MSKDSHPSEWSHEVDISFFKLFPSGRLGMVSFDRLSNKWNYFLTMRRKDSLTYHAEGNCPDAAQSFRQVELAEARCVALATAEGADPCHLEK